MRLNKKLEQYRRNLFKLSNIKFLLINLNNFMWFACLNPMEMHLAYNN